MMFYNFSSTAYLAKAVKLCEWPIIFFHQTTMNLDMCHDPVLWVLGSHENYMEQKRRNYFKDARYFFEP